MELVRYEDFLKKQKVLSFYEANHIYELILSVKEEKDFKLSKLLEELINHAVEYAEIRSRWLLISNREIMGMNATRSQYHDLFIASVNKVSGYMSESGYGKDWGGLLGEDRKRIGDFACYISYIQGVNAR